MPYGSARLRMYYGAGDYGRALATTQMTGGYYQAGGFFSSLGRSLGLKSVLSNIGAKAGAFVKSAGGKLLSGVGGKLIKGIPILGTALTAFDIAKDVYNAYKGPASSPAAVKAVAAAGGGAALPAFSAAGIAGKKSRGGGGRKRKRRPSRMRVERGSRRRRPRGDYGDDWSGGKPSRDKRGRYLTKAGGRHHHRRHQRRRRHRGGKGRVHVSFTTKGGRRVSFNARRGDGEY